MFELSFWNALNPQKVTNTLNAIEFYDDDNISKSENSDKLQAKIKQIGKQKTIINTPDDIRNLVVLCREHHRLNYTEIHTVTFPIWLAISAVPIEGGILTREQMILAMKRVRKIDDELAALAENNYLPQRLLEGKIMQHHNILLASIFQRS